MYFSKVCAEKGYLKSNTESTITRISNTFYSNTMHLARKALAKAPPLMYSNVFSIYPNYRMIILKFTGMKNDIIQSRSC